MLNKVMLIGRVGKDGELRSTAQGKDVLSFSLATSKTWTSNGEKKEQTEWHNVVFFGKSANTIARWVTKGRKIWVEGEIQYRQWEDKHSGQKRYATQIQAESIQFLDKGKEQDAAPTLSIPDFSTPDKQEFNSMDDIPF